MEGGQGVGEKAGETGQELDRPFALGVTSLDGLDRAPSERCRRVLVEGPVGALEVVLAGSGPGTELPLPDQLLVACQRLLLPQRPVGRALPSASAVMLSSSVVAGREDLGPAGGRRSQAPLARLRQRRRMAGDDALGASRAGRHADI